MLALAGKQLVTISRYSVGMDSNRLIARLREHQAAVLSNFDLTRRFVDERRAPDAMGLARLRGDLRRLLTNYQYFKHHEIFDVFIADGTSEQARIARRLKAECISLGEEVRQHIALWSDIGIEANWIAYRPAVIAFIERVCAHMDYEKRAAIALLVPPDGDAGIAPPAVHSA